MSKYYIDGGSDDRGSGRAAFFWILLLSILLSWLPFIGPLFAGFVGGRKAVRATVAFWAALIPAALWAGLLYWASSRQITIGDQSVDLAPLKFFAPLYAASIVGGALIASVSHSARVLGFIVIIAGVVYFFPKARDTWNIASLLLPQGEAVYDQSKNKTCPENLQQLYSALQFYTDEWDALPPAERWMDAIQDKVPKDEYLRCPEVRAASPEKFGYAMNPALAGKPLRDIPDRKATPLFYDSSELEKNARTGPDSIPQPGRHTGRNNILYADGHVEVR